MVQSVVHGSRIVDMPGIFIRGDLELGRIKKKKYCVRTSLLAETIVDY